MNDVYHENIDPHCLRSKRISIDRKNLFDISHNLKTDLKKHSVRGGMITIASQGIMFCFRIGSISLLSRLLTPGDFGLIAIVTVVTGFVAMFKDAGLSIATIQSADINHKKVSTLFWLNVALSAGLMLATIALAPVLAWFYEEPRLTLLTTTMAATFLISGLSVQHMALLRRRMRFGKIALVEISSNLIGIIAGIGMACYGVGYWALVWMRIATITANTIGIWIVSGWRPGLPQQGTGVRPMISFGGYLTGFSFINYFARNLDDMLIGYYWGSGVLGIYSHAYKLLMLPLDQINNPISSVAVPTLSRLQDDPDRYRRFYSRVVNIIAFFSMPLVVTLLSLSDEIIYIVLGSQWSAVGKIFRVLAISALFQPVLATVGWIYTTLDQTKRMFRWGLYGCSVIILSFFIGLPWGAYGVAVAYTVCNLTCIAIPSLVFAFRYAPVRPFDFFRAISCPLGISMLMLAVILLLKQQYTFDNAVAVTMVSSLAGFCIFLLSLLLWKRARVEVMDNLGAILGVYKTRNETKET